MLVGKRSTNLTISQLFENKVDHTTYFGANLEYIQGYHPPIYSPGLLSNKLTAQ